MYLKLILAGISVFVFSTLGARAATDVTWLKEVQLEVKKGKQAKYELQSTTFVRKTYHSTEALGESVEVIPECWNAELTHLTANVNGVRLGDERVSTLFAPVDYAFFSDEKSHVISLSGKIDPGDMLAYTYEEKYHDVAYMPTIIIPNIGHMERFEISVRHPAIMSVRFDFFFPREEAAYSIDSTSPEQTILVFDSLEEAEVLPYFAFNDMHAAVHIGLSCPGVILSPSSPKEFTLWYLSNPELPPGLADDVVLDIQPQLDSAGSPRDKLAIIDDYIRTNIRYVIDDRDRRAIFPRPPSALLADKYGDCLDRAYLAKTLAAREGITTNLVLLAAEPSPWFDGAVATAMFNHAICAYTDSAGTVFFDPTARYLKFGDLWDILVEKPALILDPGNPRWVTIPNNNVASSIEVRATADIDSLQDARVEIVLLGNYARNVEMAENEFTGVELRNSLASLIARRFERIYVSGLTMTDSNAANMTFIGTADLSMFVVSSECCRYIPAGPFTFHANRVVGREEDGYGVHFETPEHMKLRLLIKAPEYAMDTVAESIGESDAAYFCAKGLQDESGLVDLTYEFARRSSILRGESRDEFIALCRQYLGNKKQMYILSGRTP